MYIAIKSELDSRVLVYPLMRILKSFGSILVVSSNKQLNRLIDNEEEGGFRNIRVIVDESGATDDVFADYGIVKGDFDFVLLDNVGALDYDVCLVPLGYKHSEAFDNDVLMLLEKEEATTRLIQFGKAPKAALSKEEIRRASGKEQTTEDNYDPAAKHRTDTDERKKAFERNKTVTVPYPTFQDIEDVEAEHRFYIVDQTLANALYDVFKDVLVIDKLKFKKEVRKKDESSGYIKSRNSTRA